MKIKNTPYLPLVLLALFHVRRKTTEVPKLLSLGTQEEAQREVRP